MSFPSLFPGEKVRKKDTEKKPWKSNLGTPGVLSGGYRKGEDTNPVTEFSQKMEGGKEGRRMGGRGGRGGGIRSAEEIGRGREMPNQKLISATVSFLSTKSEAREYEFYCMFQKVLISLHQTFLNAVNYTLN